MLLETHLFDEDCVILDERAWGAEYHYSTVGRVVQYVVAHVSVRTREADPVRPFSVGVGSTRTYIIILKARRARKLERSRHNHRLEGLTWTVAFVHCKRGDCEPEKTNENQ